MATGYCVTCKEVVEIKNPKKTKTKKGKAMLKGTCSKCNKTTVCTFKVD